MTAYVDYNTAWRNLNQEGVNQMIACSKTLIIPWLQRWNIENMGSVVDRAVDDENHIQHVFICHG